SVLDSQKRGNWKVPIPPLFVLLRESDGCKTQITKLWILRTRNRTNLLSPVYTPYYLLLPSHRQNIVPHRDHPHRKRHPRTDEKSDRRLYPERKQNHIHHRTNRRARRIQLPPLEHGWRLR